MKNLIYYITSVIILFAMSLHAQDDKNLQQAIEKGKSDLLEVLSKSDKQFNFGLESGNIQQSRSAAVMPHKEMRFKQLLDYNQQGVNSVLSKTQKLIVPFVNNTNKVLATISVSDKDQAKFKVVELINHQYRNELNQLPDEIKNRNFENITIVYVPNLNTTIYIDNDKSYTSYKGRDVRSATPTKDLMEILKADAIVFQKKYGDQLKKGKLLY